MTKNERRKSPGETKKATAIIDEAKILEEIMSVPMTERSRKEMTLNIADHQFLCRLMTVRDDANREELRKYLKEIYLADNKQLCENVSKVIAKEVAETISPIWQKLEDLAKGQKEISDTLIAMNKRMKVIEDQVFITDDNRIRALERYASWGWTFVRGAIYVITAVVLSIMAYFQLHGKMK